MTIVGSDICIKKLTGECVYKYLILFFVIFSLFVLNICIICANINKLLFELTAFFFCCFLLLYKHQQLYYFNSLINNYMDIEQYLF